MSDSSLNGGTTSLVNEMLREYGTITRAALHDYLPSHEPRRYLYDILADYPTRGGKMMRPSLCIAMARAFGAPLEDAIKTAVAIELLHNALLIHDDIEDESEERRGRPTLHLLHGVPLALNAGDLLSAMSLRPLLDNCGRVGTQLSLRILQETERMFRESAEGQAMELGWRRENVLDLDDSDYLRMVLKKTCWLGTIYPSRVGTLIGTRLQVDLEPMTRFGFFLGAAFQIRDDLLNLEADEAYGKERDGDLWEGKRTLMLIHLLRESKPKERRRVAEVLAADRQHRTLAEVSWMRKLMDVYGSLEYTRQIALAMSGAALYELKQFAGRLRNSRDKRFLEQMAVWVIDRS
jgi:geranylgeranyl diphosphate synthase type II